ncbi:MAG: vWA domain-containing protein [Myxococcota bacterium]|nr:vWA domain-containing protein [Myxococcota bacterium]
MMPDSDKAVAAVEEWQISAVGGIDIFAIVLLALGCAVAAYWTWRSLDTTHRLSHRVGIMVARVAALAIALGLALQPTVHFRQLEDMPSELAVLVDVSGSMTRGTGDTRLQLAEQMVARAHKDLTRLKEGCQVVWYCFSDDLVPVGGAEQAFSSAPKRSKTDIRQAISRLLEERATSPLKGIVLISDGADTEISMAPEEDIDVSWAKRSGVPINTIFIENPGKRKDLAIERVDVEPFAFTRSETPVVVSLRSTGLPDREVEAYLWQDGSVVQRRIVHLVGGKGRISFSVFPSTLGHQVFTVTVPVSPMDEVPENNRVHVAFDVIRDKFRILHLAGQPSWDQRFLRETLKAWPRVDLVSFYILRTAYQSTTFGTSGMALIPFPTEEIFKGHLNEFDIIIFQNFKPAQVGVDNYLDQIATFVKRGGAFVIIAGGDGVPGNTLVASELSAALPVKLLPAQTPPSRLINTSPFRLKLTPSGTRHPLMQLFSSPQDAEQAWRSLARLDGIGRVGSLTPGALRLVEHPFVAADDGPAPVIAVKEVEEGRTMAILTDAMWRWRFTGPMRGGSADAYTNFWHQAVSWLTRSPKLDQLRVQVSPAPVHVGQALSIDIELTDESYQPVPGGAISSTIQWIHQNGSEQHETFEALLDDHGRYHREWFPSFQGPHVLTVKTTDGRDAETHFLVTSDRKEISHLRADDRLLREIATHTGGVFQTGAIQPMQWARGDRSAQRVLSQIDVSLWDHPITLILFILFLSGEWLLRRRMGLE